MTKRNQKTKSGMQSVPSDFKEEIAREMAANTKAKPQAEKRRPE